MKRKVIQLAPNTLVVSLPSEWVKKYGLEKGDELNAAIEQDAITFRTQSPVDGNKSKSIAVDISGSSVDFVKSLVSVLHKSGYDEIEFVSNDTALLEVVKKRMPECMGFELVECTQMRAVVRNLAGDDPTELERLMRRVFLVTMQMGQGVQEVLDGKNIESVPELIELEVTNNRLTNYCHRLLNKQSRGPSTMYAYALSWILESIADEFRDLLKSNDFPNKPIVPLFSSINAHLRDLYEFTYSTDVSLMDHLRSTNKQLWAESEKLADSPSRVYAQLLIKRIYDCFGSATGLKFLQSRA